MTKQLVRIITLILLVHLYYTAPNISLEEIQQFQLPTDSGNFINNNQQHNNLENTTSTNDGGIFGYWKYDNEGLPYFEYILDELTNPKASWPNTEQIPPLNVTRTDHFYLFGNDRINVKAVDDGYVELFSSERGPMWCNYFEPEYSNLGGGFSYFSISQDNQKYSSSSSYLYGPHNPGTEWKREFHAGSYKTSLKVQNINLVGSMDNNF